MERKNGFTHKIKREVREAQGGACACCGQIPHKLEVHHIQPLSHGGANTIENAVGLCSAPCHDLIDELALKREIYFHQIMEPSQEYVIGLLNSPLSAKELAASRTQSESVAADD